MNLQQLLEQPSKLPTIPKVVQQLINSFSAEDVSIDEIARHLAADPTLSAKLLRLANSAYFHVSRTVNTVDDALRMLGFVMVRNLVLGSGISTAFRNTPGMNLQQFWRYNLYTACASRWLAARGGENADFVFTVGLLHGIGQLQMHAALGEAVLKLDKKINVLDADRADAEQEALGFHYGTVSAGLAKTWNFPDPIIAALSRVPKPLDAAEFSNTAAWVHMGAWQARNEVLNLDEAASLARYPSAVGQRLLLQPDWTDALACANPQTSSAIPPLSELTEGLDAMFG
ncbi:MAG: HDOD domain-containing protein [Rhizobacter sp.]